MSSKKTKTTFAIQSANLLLITFLLKSTDLTALSQELSKQFGSQPDYFDEDPVVLDLSEVASSDNAIDFKALIKLLNDIHLKPFAVRGGSPEQMDSACSAGLIRTPDVTPATPRPQTAAKANDLAAPQPSAPEIVREVREIRVAAPSMVIDKPLRSGQQIYAQGVDLIVTAVVSFGAEVIADGSIHVYAPLRGRVIAGAQGNTQARIFTTCLEPELISIAGVYRTTEKPLPDQVRGKPAMVYLENDSLVMVPIELSRS